MRRGCRFAIDEFGDRWSPAGVPAVARKRDLLGRVSSFGRRAGLVLSSAGRDGARFLVRIDLRGAGRRGNARAPRFGGGTGLAADLPAFGGRHCPLPVRIRRRDRASLAGWLAAAGDLAGTGSGDGCACRCGACRRAGTSACRHARAGGAVAVDQLWRVGHACTAVAAALRRVVRLCPDIPGPGGFASPHPLLGDRVRSAGGPRIRPGRNGGRVAGGARFDACPVCRGRRRHVPRSGTGRSPRGGSGTFAAMADIPRLVRMPPR